MSNFLKIRPVGAELFHADGRIDGQTDRGTDRQTDITKLIVAFRNFANAPKTTYTCVKVKGEVDISNCVIKRHAKKSR
jgi:hypothetical protein